MMIPLMISNMAAGNVSIQLGARGKCTNMVMFRDQVHIVSETLFGQFSMEMRM